MTVLRRIYDSFNMKIHYHSQNGLGAKWIDLYCEVIH